MKYDGPGSFVDAYQKAYGELVLSLPGRYSRARAGPSDLVTFIPRPWEEHTATKSRSSILHIACMIIVAIIMSIFHPFERHHVLSRLSKLSTLTTR